MKTVQSAELQRYNANNRGARTGDCVKRALSLAFDVPYSEIGKVLNQKMKELKETQWNINKVYYPVMLQYGAGGWETEGINPDHTTTLDEFVDNIADPNKNYLVITGKSPKHSDHIVCVRDGKVWDSWDSRDQYVFKYSVTPHSGRNISEKQLSFGHLAREFAEPMIDENIEKYIKRKNLPCTFWEIWTYKAMNYQIRVSCKLKFNANEIISKDRKYEFEIVYPIEPTMNEEEAIKFIKETSKIRTYDRMYAIEQNEKKLIEAEEIKKASHYSGLDSKHLFLDGREERFFNTLPGWVKPLVRYLHIYEPGRMYDSYYISIFPLPSDHDHEKNRAIKFQAYNSAQLKDMLDRYKKLGQVPGEDYDPFEEY